MGLRRAIEVLGARDAGERRASGQLTLDYDGRTKTRQLAILDDGQEIALGLPRGTVLEDGQHLLCTDGSVIAVVAAPETLSRVATGDELALTRAAYHLGNRHVPVQITQGALFYQHDHVLDGMVRALGLAVESVTAPFQPEGGAYQAGHSHGAGADHDHDHDQDHDHDHDHDPGGGPTPGHHHRQGQGHGQHHHDRGHPHPRGPGKPRRG